MAILDFIINQVLRQPPIFMGLIVLIGSIFLKRSFQKTLTSVLKSVIGMMILSAGAGVLIKATKPIINIFVEAVGIQGVSTDMWTSTSMALETIDASGLPSVGAVLICAWILNLLLARFTPIKTVYLTAHQAFQDSAAMTFFLFVIFGMTGTPLFVTAVLICGVYWWLGPALLRPYLTPLIGDTNITLGHNLVFSGILVTYIARLFGKPSQSAEDINLPGWLSIFKDSVCSYGIIMGLIYLIIVMIAGPTVVSGYASGQNFIIYGLLQGFQMAVGITVLLTGVRMFLNELIPAFKGFSDKLIPGAIAAVDSPIFWSYGQTSALLGFISTVAGQLVGVVLLVAFNSPVIAIPSVIPLFFGGCTLGVFANAWGGWKGVIGSTFIMGIITICGSAGLAWVANYPMSVWGHSDWSTLWFGVFGIAKWVAGLLGFPV